jgi:hypothetical protein
VRRAEREQQLHHQADPEGGDPKQLGLHQRRDAAVLAARLHPRERGQADKTGR